MLIKKILGIAPKPELDGSFSPSWLSLKLATVSKTDYKEVPYKKYIGKKSKILVILTEQKNMKMQNGKFFSTGNHPVETFLPMLHLKKAGFDFKIVTPTGRPVVIEKWAFPEKDIYVRDIYTEYQGKFENPDSLKDFVSDLDGKADSYAAVFIPGGHGSMLGLPKDINVGTALHWAHQNNLFTISLCHGPSSFFATTLNGQKFIYEGYRMCVFPDTIDRQTPKIGYMPGKMPWKQVEGLAGVGANIVNSRADKSVCVDRKLITGASPSASNELGEIAAKTILNDLNSQN